MHANDLGVSTSTKPQSEENSNEQIWAAIAHPNRPFNHKLHGCMHERININFLRFNMHASGIGPQKRRGVVVVRQIPVSHHNCKKNRNLFRPEELT